MKKVMGGSEEEELFGNCTVKATCPTGSVECTSDVGKCRKGNNYVQ